MRLAVIILGCATGAMTGLSGPSLQAQPAELQLVAAARPPYMTDTDGQAGGPAVELVLELARRTGLAPTDGVRIMPFQRAVLALDQGSTLYPALLRTPLREPRYQWIGEVHADRAVFFTRRGAPQVNNLDILRRFDRVNVMRGSELQAMLQSFDIGTIEATNSEADNARLLQAGRIDVWFALKAVGRSTWLELGFQPDTLQSGETFATLPFWIVTSNNTSPAAVARLRAEYQAMRRDGRFERITRPLQKLETVF